MPEERKQPAANPEICARTVLNDLYKLLEEYAPVWYTEEHHNQVAEALNLRG